MEVISKLGGLGRGIGIGILSVISIVAVVMFSEFCYETTEDGGKFDIKNPVTYKQNLYDSAVAAAIFASISAVACIVAIVFALLLSGQKILITIISLIPIVCGVACIICEGCFYDFYLKEATRYFPSHITNSETHNSYPQLIRNTSKGQDYIKDAIKAFYEQGVKNIKDENKDTEYVKNYLDKYLLSWDDVEKSIGKSFDFKNTPSAGITTTKYFNYPNLWLGQTGTPSYPDFSIDSNKFYLTFYYTEGTESSYEDTYIPGYVMAYAEIPDENGDPIPLASVVASLGFTAKFSGSLTAKRSCCWSKSSTEYDCKTLKKELKDEEILSPYYKSMSHSPWTLSQYIMIEDHYITVTKQDEDEKNLYYADYLVDNFPIAYTILSYEDYNKNKDKTKELYYEEDTDHFKVSGKDYVEYKVDNKNKDEVEYDSDQKYWCTKEPSDFDEAFGTEEKEGVCDNDYTNVANFINAAVDKDGKPALAKAFDFVNIRVWPSFAMKYWKSKAVETVFIYSFGEDLDTRIVQFSVAAFIITIVGIIFLAASVVTGFLPGSD